MAIHKELRCPSCGALSTMEHAACPACGARLTPEKDAMDVDDILSDISQLISDLANEAPPDGARGSGTHSKGAGGLSPGGASASSRRRNEAARAGIDKALETLAAANTTPGPELEIPDERPAMEKEDDVAASTPVKGAGKAGERGGKRAAAGEGGGEEAYQCLICGSSIPADAEKCSICGTIFMDEAEAGSFHGLPVARICQSSEIDAEESDLRQSHRTEEIRVEPPPPGPGGRPMHLAADDLPVVEYGPRGGPVRADELPAAEFEAAKRSPIKKKIIRKKS